MPSPETMSRSSTKHWYALKVFYNRVANVEDWLRQQEVQTYIPMRYEETIVDGKRKIRTEPAVSSLLFLRETERFVLDLQTQMKARYPLMAYFNRETKKPGIIPEQEMNTFMLVTSAGDTALEYLDTDEPLFRSGDRVRVTGGIFEGAEGYIKRIKGNRRLIVSIEGVIAVATAYIPGHLLEKL